jgi:beta-galactosidase beta subunit
MREHELEITYSKHLSRDFKLLFNLIKNGKTIICFVSNHFGNSDIKRKRKLRTKIEIDKTYIDYHYLIDLEEAIKHFEINEFTFINPH